MGAIDVKILQINSVCGIGSTGRIATDIHQTLKEQGHESIIAYGRGIPMNCESSIRIGSKYDNYAHVALTRIYDKHGFGSTKATEIFIEKIEEFRPDIIHLHNIHGYYINIKLLFDYLKKADKSVVWTLHDCWAFTGHCSHFDFIQCSKWKLGCNHCPQKNNYPSSLFIDNSKGNYKVKKEIFTGIKNMTIITPSTWLANLVKDSFLNEYPVKVINNGIDLEIFSNMNSDFRERHKLKNKFIILGVANIWEEKKGFNHFLELSNNIKGNEIIVLIGLTEAQKRICPENIIGITRTNNIKELAEIYSAADVFVNPTLEDTFPTTNLEALACGTPVITFDTGGSVESIDGSCGIVVEKGNVMELNNAIKLFRDNKYFLDNCLNRSKKYDKREKYNEYLDMYNHIQLNGGR